MRKFVLLAAALATVAALAPMGAQADGHCKDIFVFSGDASVRDPENNKAGGLNLGSVGCQRASANVNTNFLTPGAKDVWAGVGSTQASSAPSGTLVRQTATGATLSSHALTFTSNSLRGRWESNAVAIGNAAKIVVTISGITTPTGTNGSTQTVTYTKQA